MHDLTEAMTALGFSPNTNPTYSEVKRRWKDLCQKHHPDKPGGSADQFRKVTHAYKMLTDAEYRQKEREQAVRRGNMNARGALDIRMMIPVSFEDAFFGRRIHLSYSVCHLDENLQPIAVGDEGEVELDRLTIDLNPNTSDGYQQLLSGRGHRSGEERGNAMIIIQVLPHPRFTVRDGNVHSAENLPLDVCLKGGQIDILTMYGLRPVRVKAGTKPGDIIRIKGCGPVRDVAFGMKQRGDHLLTVNISFPTRDELKKAKAWEKLDIDWKEEPDDDQQSEDWLRLFEELHGKQRRP